MGQGSLDGGQDPIWGFALYMLKSEPHRCGPALIIGDQGPIDVGHGPIDVGQTL